MPSLSCGWPWPATPWICWRCPTTPSVIWSTGCRPCPAWPTSPSAVASAMPCASGSIVKRWRHAASPCRMSPMPCGERTWKCRPASSRPRSAISPCVLTAATAHPRNSRHCRWSRAATAMWCAWAKWPRWSWGRPIAATCCAAMPCCRSAWAWSSNRPPTPSASPRP